MNECPSHGNFLLTVLQLKFSVANLLLLSVKEPVKDIFKHFANCITLYFLRKTGFTALSLVDTMKAIHNAEVQKYSVFLLLL